MDDQRRLIDVLPPLIQPDQLTGDDRVRIAVPAGAGRRAAEERAGGDVGRPRLPGRLLFTPSTLRLKRIREQLDVAGTRCRACAANNATQIAEALLVLIYTPALGDPEGPALLGGDIAARHNFGIEGAAGVRRDYLAWSMPREQVGDGSPWHIEGSIARPRHRAGASQPAAARR